MTKQTIENKGAPSTLSADWAPFARKLAAVLGGLEEDQYLILSPKRGDSRFIQFACQGSYGMRVETTSNDYLAAPEHYDAQQIASLIGAGWSAPTGKPEQSVPEKDPDGSPNFFAEFSAPVACEQVADLAVQTLAEIMQVPHPGFLEYQAFDADGGSLPLPGLGMKQATSTDEGRERGALRLLAMLQEITGISDLAYDEDGDIGLRYGSALTFIRLISDPACVRLFSTVLSNVDEPPGIFARLNDLNIDETLVRFVFRNRSIGCSAEIPAEPLMTAHVSQVFQRFCAIADDMGKLLQGEFGGETAFVEAISSSLKH